MSVRDTVRTETRPPYGNERAVRILEFILEFSVVDKYAESETHKTLLEISQCSFTLNSRFCSERFISL